MSTYVDGRAPASDIETAAVGDGAPAGQFYDDGWR
jgi:hypothetical protein